MKPMMKALQFWYFPFFITIVLARVKGIVGPRHLVTFAEQKKLGSIQGYNLHVAFRKPLFPMF